MPKPYTPNDKWSQRAAAAGYRARSVYKLMELDERFHLLKPGMTVIDVGAAPGSWLQYASQMVGPKGKVIGFDLQEIAPVAENVVTHVLDVTDREMLETLLAREGAAQADLLLSDIAPSTSGVKDVDQWRSVELAQIAMDTGMRHLHRGGKAVTKIFRGADFDLFLAKLKIEWKNVKVFTAEASRDRSREVYIVATKR
jgi:23S rRNA (uridine2552-2'-O)-methyltransferase